MFKGYTLSYQGRQYSPQQTNKTQNKEIDNKSMENLQVEEKKASKGFEKLVELFSEIGALTIRYHIGQGQRVGLLQQISRDDYLQNPVEKPAHGDNQTNLFAVSSSATLATKTTRRLEEISHYTLGKGKVLNERAQPLVHVNTIDLHGEEAIWDIIHSPVWGTGINLAYQLSKQGFLYIVNPDLDAAKMQEINNDLALGQFQIITESDREFIRTVSGHQLKCTNLSGLQINLNPEQAISHGGNGLVISAEKNGISGGPMGWIIHRNKKIVEQEDADNLIRIMRIAKGGFYELTPQQQKLLQSSLLQNNGFGLFTQNQAFNAMHVILAKLERDFGYDPSAQMGSSLDTSWKRMDKLFHDTDVAEDFLTGILITEMVQPLMATQADSTRTKLPLRFNNPFKVTLNNSKAIAYAYELKDKQSHSLLQFSDQENKFYHDPEMLDIGIHGTLQTPELNSPKRVAALLATAVLVAEQIIIEQLLPAVCESDLDPRAIALKKILLLSDPDGEAHYEQLKQLVADLPRQNNKLVLGLQIPYCDDIVNILRKVLGHDGLIEIVEQLYQSDADTNLLIEKLQNLQSHQNALVNLMEIGKIFQELPGISVVTQGSRGINAGLELVVNKLMPKLLLTTPMDNQSTTNDNLVAKQPHPQIHTDMIAQQQLQIDACPWLKARFHNSTNTNDQPSGLQDLISNTPNTKEQSKKTSQSWCNYFVKAAVPVIAISATAATILSINYSE